MCCSVLQCVAVCCSVLQCVTVCCSVLQCVTVRCSVLQCVTVRCSVLQYSVCVAVCCWKIFPQQDTVAPPYTTIWVISNSCVPPYPTRMCHTHSCIRKMNPLCVRKISSCHKHSSHSCVSHTQFTRTQFPHTNVPTHECELCVWHGKFCQSKTRSRPLIQLCVWHGMGVWHDSSHLCDSCVCVPSLVHLSYLKLRKKHVQREI